MLKTYFIPFLALLLIGGFLFFYDRFTQNKTSSLVSTSDVPAQRQYWEKRLKDIGAVKAYQEFKTLYAQSDFSTQHLAVHLFGQLIYQNEGIEGITLCDGSFSYGCYHSFFASVISDHGIKVLPDLDRVCTADKEGAVACQHGIGHGLLEYMGTRKLTDALNACATLTPLDPYFSCYSGVFMGYNVPIVITETSAQVTVRELDLKNLFDPCDKIDDKFKQSCFYNLPQLWDKILNKDYSQIGKLCTLIEEERDRIACFNGIGSVAAPSSNYDVLETATKCNQIPDEKGQQFCRIRASWAFFSSTGNRGEALTFCEGLSDDLKKDCVPEND